MRSVFTSSKAGRRLLSVVCATAIVVSLLCMGGVSVSAADLTFGQTFTDTGLATKVDLNLLDDTDVPIATDLSTTDEESGEVTYTDADGDGKALLFTGIASTKSKSGAGFTFGGLDPRKTYTVSMQVKGDKGIFSGNLWINYYDENNESVLNTSTNKALATNLSVTTSQDYSDWYTISVTLNTLYGGNAIKLGTWIKNAASTGTTDNVFYIDNVVIEEAAITTSSTTGSFSFTAVSNTNGKMTTTIETGLGVGADGNDEVFHIALGTGATAGAGGSKTVSNLDPDKYYTVSMWIKCEASLKSGGNVYAAAPKYTDDSGTVVAEAGKVYKNLSVASGWKQYIVTAVKPNALGNLLVGYWVNHKSGTEARDVYIDAMTVYECIYPEVAGATIATTTDTAKQDLRFTVDIPGIVPDDATNIEYGAYLVRTALLEDGTVAELTEETYQANKGKIIKGSATAASAADVPVTFDVNLKNAVNFESRCGVEISLRAYVKYTSSGGTEYIVYSTNTSTSPDVTDGVASRSVYGVAYTIVNTELANGATGLTYDDTAGKFTWNETAVEATDAEVLQFAIDNIGYLG